MRHFISAAGLLLANLATTPAAWAEVPAVVTDMPVVQSLVAQVMGDLGTPEVLVSSGADPHDFQLRPSQARALATAEAIFWIGPEMTPWLAEPVAAATTAARTALLDVPGTELRHFGDDADGGAAEQAEETGHGHAGVDPHAWLDPDNARVWLLAIADTLSALDPANAPAYRANAAAASAAIAALDADLGSRAGTITGGIVVAHDAYGYLARHYGLTIAGTLAEGDAAQPGAARIAELAALIEGGSVVCILPEAGRDPKALTALAAGGARLGAPLDPAGLTLPPGAGLYAALLGDLIGKIADCAG